MKKFVPEMADGVATGKFLQTDASIVDAMNPTVAVDSQTSLIRVVGVAILTAILKG